MSESTKDERENVNGRHQVSVGTHSDPAKVATHVLAQLSAAPLGTCLELVAIGPAAVSKAVRSTAILNGSLAPAGRYVNCVNCSRMIEVQREGSDNVELNATVVAVTVRALT